MKLEVGKCYVDDHGDIFGPIKASAMNGKFIDGFTTWREDGTQFYTVRTWDIDLFKEYKRDQ